MRVLIFHGYLLHGTGSNVYNANLTRALARQGHEVHLFCQDRRADQLDWVRDNDRITVHVPNIGGLLPVFVADRYEGFEVKTFPELTDEELDRYLDANVHAVRQVVEQYGEPDAALANHLIMGPLVLARAGLRYAIKVHGSDLSYTVGPHPERFVPYALEGTEGAAGILAGSSHTARVLFETLPDPSIPDRTRIGPPGVDVHRFRPHEPAAALREVERLAERLDSERPEGDGSGDSFGRDGPAIATALRDWAGGDPRVLFVGKFLVSKGVDLLAAAWPLVHRRSVERGADSPRLLFIGFGAFESGLRELVRALEAGDLEAARAVAARGRGYEEDEDAPLPILTGFLTDPPEGYAEAARAAAGSILIGGRLAHDEVADVMPAAETFAMTSTWPEAFGMVPAESAACGVPPVSADHSGMREVSRQLAEVLDPDLAPLLSFPVDADAVAELAERLDGWLAMEPEERQRAGMALARRVDELWSWEGVARTVIAASRGELQALPEVVT
ncbi:MAG TPA: glycosyltransferase family 4 protein [Solirubrobacterales bacterium]|nr:glycosyltransferase family 4 protein [Solirubrobacterales bacterium]